MFIAIYQLSKALDAQYDALYSTGKDVLEKRKKQIDEEENLRIYEKNVNEKIKRVIE